MVWTIEHKRQKVTSLSWLPSRLLELYSPAFLLSLCCSLFTCSSVVTSTFGKYKPRRKFLLYKFADRDINNKLHELHEIPVSVFWTPCLKSVETQETGGRRRSIFGKENTGWSESSPPCTANHLWACMLAFNSPFSHFETLFTTLLMPRDSQSH